MFVIALKLLLKLRKNSFMFATPLTQTTKQKPNVMVEVKHTYTTHARSSKHDLCFYAHRLFDERPVSKAITFSLQSIVETTQLQSYSILVRSSQHTRCYCSWYKAHTSLIPVLRGHRGFNSFSQKYFGLWHHRLNTKTSTILFIAMSPVEGSPFSPRDTQWTIANRTSWQIDVWWLVILLLLCYMRICHMWDGRDDMRFARWSTTAHQVAFMHSIWTTINYILSGNKSATEIVSLSLSVCRTAKISPFLNDSWLTSFSLYLYVYISMFYFRPLS